MNVLLGMANQIAPCLKFTADLPEDHKDGKCPMLDFSTWVEKIEDKTKQWGVMNILRWGFYEKPCSSKKVIEEASAMAKRTKIITLSNEIIRRMRTTDGRATTADRAEIVTGLMRKMNLSGYRKADMVNVLESGVKGYYRMRKEQDDGIRRVNRDQREGKEERERRKSRLA